VHSSSSRQEHRATHLPEAVSHLRFSSQSISLLQPSEPPEQAEIMTAAMTNMNLVEDNRIVETSLSFPACVLLRPTLGRRKTATHT
jgi:hypothetical protein